MDGCSGRPTKIEPHAVPSTAISLTGAGDGNRTHDLRVGNALLYL